MNEDKISIQELEPEDINTIENGEKLEYENAEDFGEPLKKDESK